MNFPVGTVDKNPSANAGDTGLISGPGRFQMPQSDWACAPQLLSLFSRAHAPRQEGPPQWEAHAPQMKSNPVCCN